MSEQEIDNTQEVLPAPPVKETKKKQRPPQYATNPKGKPIERYSQINNPGTQWSQVGSQPPKSRAQIVRETGELDSITSFDIQREVNETQAERARFVSWQARQNEFVMYKNMGYDSVKGLDRWEAVPYEFNALTVGQWKAIQMQEAKELDLAKHINDMDIKDANQQLRESQVETLKMKCGMFFRMDVREFLEDDEGKLYPNPDYEFERMNWPDLRDAVEAATYKNTFQSQGRDSRQGFQSAIS